MKKLLLFLLLSNLYIAQQWGISSAERNALINIYNATSGEQWSQKWDLEKDPKYWYGIKIKSGNVVEINLRGNALKGNFPVFFSSFPKLQKLDVSSNQLSGEVSSSISSLANLARLDISNNRLSGDPTAIISPLSKLEELSIGNNLFTFSDIETFLQNFPLLEALDLSHIGLNAVPQKISELHNLQSVNLSNNSISQNFNNLSSLRIKELNLSGNHLTKIPVEISTIPNLISLDLSRNLFSTNYADALANMRNLEWLSLENNQIESFPVQLSQLTKLVHLNFSDNKISGGLENLLVLKDLEQIYLDKNLLSGNFPTSLLQLNKLQMLSLTANKLSGEIPENIPALTFLDNNRFTKQEIKTFVLREKAMADFTYSPQRYDEPKIIYAGLGGSPTLPQSLWGDEYQFSWFKNLDQKTTVTAANYHINHVELEDYGDYTCEAYYFEQLPKELLEISFFREPVSLIQVLGTEEINQQSLIVYPNPATDFIHIKTKKLRIEKVFIFDLSGKLILEEKSNSINVNHLPSATYVISIQTSEGLKSFKFIKH